MGEIVADCVDHIAGERELVDWDRLVDGQVVTFRNIPVMYLRRATVEEYYAQHPTARGRFNPSERFFWLVSID
jgi:hypothetical protein